MKKLLIVFIFLLGFMFMPLVHAEEIPREGVTYFLEYPDGTEDVKEDYDEAIAASEEEKLIFSGETDENGQVVLEDIASEGTLRVVQEVPNGYSTDEREVIINLEESKKVEFKITKGLINPKTGFSILKILLVLAILMICTVLTNKNKKTLLVLPLLLLAGLVNVKADSDDLVINVKDNLGRAQKGVTVKVYAKPTIDAAPAIKLDANGGRFGDGSTLLYVRIPHNECTQTEFNRLFDDDFYVTLSVLLAFKENNYYVRVESPSELNMDTCSNGDIFKLIWDEVPAGTKLYNFYGNGGFATIKGKVFDKISYYNYGSNIGYYQLFYYMKKGNEKFVGFSENSSCETLINNSYSLNENESTYNLYMCWDSHPDGIYVNETIFTGTYEACYQNILSFSQYRNDSFYIEAYDMQDYLQERISKQYDFIFKNIAGSQIYFSKLYKKIASEDSENDSYEDVNKLEIVRDGQTVFSVSSNEISEILSEVPTEEIDRTFYINNAEKATQLKSLISGLSEYGCIPAETSEHSQMQVPSFIPNESFSNNRFGILPIFN